jgi:hypothetical protein
MDIDIFGACLQNKDLPYYLAVTPNGRKRKKENVDKV